MSEICLTPPMEVIKACRACGSPDLSEILSFGDVPLADRLVAPTTQAEEEYRAPLTLLHCNACSLCQIRETVDPRILFGADYPYYSSVSPALLRHFGASARSLIESRALGPNSLVIEAASNDGYMLDFFHKADIPVLGIDPAEGPATAAVAKGIPTLNTFFSTGLARKLAETDRQADVFLANNVLAHVADLRGFVEGIATVLKPTGVAVVECPYLLDLLDQTEFDTIYHQHLCYFSVTALVPLFQKAGLVLNHVERTGIHGGSLRLYVSFEHDVSVGLEVLLREEGRRGIKSTSAYSSFLMSLERVRADLRAILDGLGRDGKKVVGYGAAAKATTFLDYMGIGAADLDYIADRSGKKHGLLMPGSRIAIVPPDRIISDRPDYVLILAWNFANEIMADMASYREGGGRFIVPIPSPRVVQTEKLEGAF